MRDPVLVIEEELILQKMSSVTQIKDALESALGCLDWMQGNEKDGDVLVELGNLITRISSASDKATQVLQEYCNILHDHREGEQ